MRLELSDLRDAIRAKGGAWTAEVTEISGYLDQAEDSGLFGLRIGEDEREAALQEAFKAESQSLAAAAPPPPGVDWRHHGGRNWVSPIKHQRTCGACIAFSTCAVLESRTKIDRDDPDFAIDLSEADLFFCGCGRCCRTGWSFVPALNRCLTDGVGDERAFPYVPRDQDCPPALSTQITPLVRVSGWSSEASRLGRKQAIAKNGPVIAGMRVFEDFYYYRAGTYSHTVGRFRGLHAVAVIGYDDAAGHWLVKNSWGPGWGDQGFFAIAYGECGIDSEFAFYDPFVTYVGPAA